jgi:hypothetical protein
MKQILIVIMKIPFVIMGIPILIIAAIFLGGCILLRKLSKWIIKRAEAIHS